ncbi:hypothetical protein GAP32_251 [Cronobacter phage vB_CsaM_GAP32]|uniref:Uncharacterized protein n=1 Tax=Cronobacter phage vB_CsaM_GAP32 TaxID=1141136 RepID=K4F644_9CAUD|nr:hypothetical protein GAP32_251 [Cronobacter phage vB_CsaM_GAP32]AFC21701.1 hypothetical protein GAP32_251 [Cronobacter phage vB_CsaM_GAP32]
MLTANEIVVEPGNAIIKKKPASYFEDGKDAVLLESQIKNTFNCSVLKKDDLPDGYTETVNASDIDVLMEMINSFVQR